MSRKIIHVDLDAFFASVEQNDDPALRRRPVAVGGVGPRGVVSTASYEARARGVRSAMPTRTAISLCPELVLVPPRFDRYREVSKAVRSVFEEFTPLVQPMSLDEAYLDVTENLKGLPYAVNVARAIRRRILEDTGLTASAGVSYCKFLAKMASDENKPNGMFVIPPGKGRSYVAALPVERFHGIGPATARRMRSFGIATGADLAERSEVFLSREFGKAGSHYHSLAQGIDDRPVETGQVRKSVSAEDTFPSDLVGTEAVLTEAEAIAGRTWERCLARGLHARTITVKIRFEDFEEKSRSRTSAIPIAEREEYLALVRDLTIPMAAEGRRVRLLGVAASGFRDPAAVTDRQFDLFA